MGDKSGIQWTDATWNPIVGCSRVSSGCTRCYAEKQAFRAAAMGISRYEGLTHKVGDEIRWTGEVRLVEEALTLPLRWTRPRRIFANSMSDLFHEKVEDEWIDRIFRVMWRASRHTFQILTKRPKRMLVWATNPENELRQEIGVNGMVGLEWPLPNVWLGVSVEDQATADERIPLLLQTPAAVRFISYEPALGPVDLSSLDGGGGYRYNALCKGAPFGHYEHAARIDWVIVGGESGPGARPCDLAWIRSVVAQGRAAGVPVFVKQVGARPFDSDARWYTPGSAVVPVDSEWRRRDPLRDRKGGSTQEWPGDIQVREFPA